MLVDILSRLTMRCMVVVLCCVTRHAFKKALAEKEHSWLSWRIVQVNDNVSYRGRARPIGRRRVNVFKFVNCSCKFVG